MSLFSASSTFEIGEIVLMPRSLGGFIYGIATLDYSVENCAFDSSVSHSTKMYAFDY